MAKTVKWQGSFSTVDASNVASPNMVIKDLDLTVDQVQCSDPMTIPGGTTDFSVPFGQITVGRRMFLRTDNEVTVKLNQNTDIGFPWHGAGVIPSGTTGLSALYITTGPSATEIQFYVAGD